MAQRYLTEIVKVGPGPPEMRVKRIALKPNLQAVEREIDPKAITWGHALANSKPQFIEATKRIYGKPVKVVAWRSSRKPLGMRRL